MVTGEDVFANAHLPEVIHALNALGARLSPSSAVWRNVLLICGGFRISSPGFLHYIGHCILNDAALFGQLEAQML